MTWAQPDKVFDGRLCPDPDDPGLAGGENVVMLCTVCLDSVRYQPKWEMSAQADGTKGRNCRRKEPSDLTMKNNTTKCLFLAFALTLMTDAVTGQVKVPELLPVDVLCPRAKA